MQRGAVLAGATAAALSLPDWMPRLAFAQPYDEPPGDILICIFLRGGADTLNMIVPFGDEGYYAARPRLAIPRPDAREELKTLDLDGFFGLHPSLAPLLPILKAQELLIVHGTGSPHENRSHFEAMDYMERGVLDGYHVSNGWIGRHLAGLSRGNPSPIRGVGWGEAAPTSMMGAPSTIALKSIMDYHLAGDEKTAALMMQSLLQLYNLESDSIYTAAQATQAAIEVVQSVNYAQYQPKNGAEYPNGEFALALRQTAALIRAQVGLEVACIDLGGWDTHANQGGTQGIQARLMNELAAGLAAFHQDLGTEMNQVSVVVMSEFGRRVAENGSGGTDHGQGGAMLILSGGLQTAQPVFAQQFSLAAEQLKEGDLAITTDYRHILTELLVKRLKNPSAQLVFPEFSATDYGLFRA
jgi:uncharacterized protein (DUF1501 family)